MTARDDRDDMMDELDRAAQQRDCSQVVMFLSMEFEEASQEVILRTIAVAPWLKCRAAVPRLIDLLEDPSEDIRAAAAVALGRMRDERATRGLATATSDTDGRVRWWACWALGRIGTAVPADVLAACLSDREWFVRRAAARALVRTREREGLSSLRGAMRHEPTIRRRLWLWLQWMKLRLVTL